ncbi:hypothetical protein EJ110_NYTH25188 [Nymphaea thermarum]|nr:hypothetical protein EJ110_NYTH25188 [Nymphaea thermarum]
MTVVDTIFDADFWESCVHLLKICVPLVKVLRLVNSEDRHSIGYLYVSIDRATEAIRDNMKGKKKLYMIIWKTIDERWSGQIHCSLHAVAYYLNPTIRYLLTFKKDREVKQLETTSMRKHHTQYDPINIDHFDILDSWVEEEPSAILDEDDLDFLNLEGAVEIIEEGEAGEQWNVGDIPFAIEGIEEALNEENEDDDEE